MNERLLRFEEVRLIDENGAQSGVLPTREALSRARAAELDLVLVAPNAQPPVCKIVDYGKHKYQQDKIQKESRLKSKRKQEVKGIKIRPVTGEHDLDRMVRRATEFLQEGNKVRLICFYRKREMAHPEVGRKKLLYITDRLGPKAKIEREPILNGKEMVMVLSPGLFEENGKKDAQTEDEQDGRQAVQDNSEGENPAQEGI